MESKTSIRRLCKALCAASLALLCVNFAPFEGKDSLNLPLCALLSLSPLVLLIKEARVILPRIDVALALVCACVFGMPVLFHPDAVRWSTMLFTCAYCVFFMMLARLVMIARPEPADLLKLIRVLVYAYTVALIVQQVCQITGLPVPYPSKLCQGYPWWKLNSLAAEPSHMSLTVCMLMFFYTQTVRVTEPRQSLCKCIVRCKWLWLCFVWTICTIPIATSLLFSPLCLLPFVNRRNAPWAAAAAATVIAAVLFTPVGNLEQASRLRDTTVAIFTTDENGLIEADESMAGRIVPTIRGVRATTTDLSALITGHGSDAATHDFPTSPGHMRVEGSAGFFNMWYNYGALCALCFWTAIFIVTVTHRRPMTVVTFLIALLMSGDYNVQFIWQIMAFSMIFKYTVCGDHKLLETLRRRPSSPSLPTE